MPDPDAQGGPTKPVSNFEPARRNVGQGPDSDGDGLSDDFESNVFGSDPNQRDADNDGLSDWSEYWIDTDPNHADTDRDGYMDGEDLAFGDPLAPNAGGAERAKFIGDVRKQFAAEGSDRDGDLMRDYLEVQSGTQVDNADSDNDGLGDMVELQLGTSPTSGGTSDLDTAREHLGERRWEAEQAGSQPSSSADEPESLDLYAASETSYAEPAYSEPDLEAPSYDEPAELELITDAVIDDLAADEPTFDGLA